MTVRVHDLRMRLALRRECRAIAREHPGQGEAEEQERLAEWLADEEPDSDDAVPAQHDPERSTERPASRGH
jgi:hypothetical protein